MLELLAIPLVVLDERTLREDDQLAVLLGDHGVDRAFGGSRSGILRVVADGNGAHPSSQRTTPALHLVNRHQEAHRAQTQSARSQNAIAGKLLIGGDNKPGAVQSLDVFPPVNLERSDKPAADERAQPEPDELRNEGQPWRVMPTAMSEQIALSYPVRTPHDEESK